MYSYGKNFWILCLSMFLFMTSFNLIIPELNGFITLLRGAEHKGLIIFLFSLSAAISRPFSGKLSDTIGRKKVMIIGMLFSVMVSLLYPLSVSSVFFFLILRFTHGFSAGFFPTGATALITDILKPEQRGKGMGIWGVAISLGIGTGQGFGSIICNQFGLTNLFFIAASVALLSGLLLINIKETLQEKQKFSHNHLTIKMTDVFEPSVIPVSIVMFLSATCSGIAFVLTPDISKLLAIENKGWFFIFYVVTTIMVRLFFSGISDKIGRRQTLAIGMFFLIISMLLIGSSNNIISYTFASVIFGIATGMSSPTIFSWTADLSHPQRRGVGTGTMFIALELGIMFGAASTLYTYNGQLDSILGVFSLGAIFATLALIYLLWHIKYRKSLT